MITLKKDEQALMFKYDIYQGWEILCIGPHNSKIKFGLNDDYLKKCVKVIVNNNIFSNMYIKSSLLKQNLCFCMGSNYVNQINWAIQDDFYSPYNNYFFVKMDVKKRLGGPYKKRLGGPYKDNYLFSIYDILCCYQRLEPNNDIITSNWRIFRNGEMNILKSEYDHCTYLNIDKYIPMEYILNGDAFLEKKETNDILPYYLDVVL